MIKASERQLKVPEYSNCQLACSLTSINQSQRLLVIVPTLKRRARGKPGCPKAAVLLSHPISHKTLA